MNEDKIDLEQKKLIDLAKDLISCKALSGQEEKLVNLLKGILPDYGFQDIKIDCWGNITARLPGKDKSLMPILFDCHLDTVAVNNQNLWHSDPYQAEIRDEKIYGRGAADMRGALAALIYGLSLINSKNLNRDIILSGTVGEEIQEGMAFKNTLEEYQPTTVIICEATDCNLNIGQRGRAEIKLKVKGKSAHTSNPEAGCNAVTGMVEWLKLIEDLKIPENDQLGRGINVLTDIISQPYPGLSVLPEECLVTFDRRLVGDETKKDLLKEYLNLLQNETLNKYWEFEAELAVAELECFTGNKLVSGKLAPAWYFNPEAEHIQKSVKALNNGGLDFKIGTYSFCTNGSMSAGFMDIPTVGYGPCTEDRAHIVDEYISFEDLNNAAIGYYNLAKVFSN
ncbi:MAG: YgeY family selenium metabolism-linked hydrolase [Bacillota bacterium]